MDYSIGIIFWTFYNGICLRLEPSPPHEYGFYSFCNPLNNLAIQIISNHSVLGFVSIIDPNILNGNNFEKNINSKNFIAAFKIFFTYGFEVEKFFIDQKSIFYVAPGDVLTIVYHKSCYIRHMTRVASNYNAFYCHMFELVMKSFKKQSELEKGYKFLGEGFFNFFVASFLAVEPYVLNSACNNQLRRNLVKLYVDICNKKRKFDVYTALQSNELQINDKHKYLIENLNTEFL